MPAGRPTELNEELLVEIRELVLDGKTMREIAEILEIPYETMRAWSKTNYHSFADKMLIYKHERMLEKAEYNIEELQSADDDKIRLQANIHVSETLGKKWYSRKNETDLTSQGDKLSINVINYERNNDTPSV